MEFDFRIIFRRHGSYTWFEQPTTLHMRVAILLGFYPIPVDTGFNETSYVRFPSCCIGQYIRLICNAFRIKGDQSPYPRNPFLNGAWMNFVVIIFFIELKHIDCYFIISLELAYIFKRCREFESFLII